MTDRRSAAALGASLVAAIVRAEDVGVYAAGSLRAPLTDVARAFERAAPGAGRIALTFGASGLLRDRIGSGERADVFASANLAHPRGLVAFGWAEAVDIFARTSMCVLASPRVCVSTDTLLATLLDPAVGVGSSTPTADPSGDYAWVVFRKADAIHPGAFDTLASKARQLVGTGLTTLASENRSSYAALLAQGAADVFVTYRTNAALACREDPSLVTVELPADLQVRADYGLAVRKDAPPRARDFAAFVLGADGRRVLASYGFEVP